MSEDCKPCNGIACSESPYYLSYLALYTPQGLPSLAPNPNLILNGPAVNNAIVPPNSTGGGGNPPGDDEGVDIPPSSEGGNPGGPPARPPVPPSVGGAGNDIVYWTCPEGLAIEFSGTLPGWIRLDPDNNRLYGVANTFRANSKAEANAIAQAAIDAFATANLGVNLFCEEPGTCVDWTDPEIFEFQFIDGFPSGGYEAYINIVQSDFQTNGFVFQIDDGSNGTFGYTTCEKTFRKVYTGPGCTIRFTCTFSGTDNGVASWFGGSSKSVILAVSCGGVPLFYRESGLGVGDMLPDVPNVYEIVIPECLVPNNVDVGFNATASPSRQTVTALLQVENL